MGAMMHEERQWQILRAAIGDYIADAAPVSSEGLRTHYRFPVSPATIRNDLAALEEQGYLTHVHTSSGRVPTDSGYRMFVDELLEPAFTRADREALDRAFRVGRALAANLCEAISRRTRTYVEALGPASSEIYAAGLTTVLNEPEFQSRKAIVALLSVVERLRQEPRIVEEFYPDDQAAPLFMIGREMRSLGRRAEGLALVAMRAVSSAADAPVFLLLGPKRMMYPKIVALFNYLRERNAGGPLALIIILLTLNTHYVG